MPNKRSSLGSIAGDALILNAQPNPSVFVIIGLYLASPLHLSSPSPVRAPPPSPLSADGLHLCPLPP